MSKYPLPSVSTTFSETWLVAEIHLRSSTFDLLNGAPD
jgi:hypothetical protein